MSDVESSSDNSSSNESTSAVRKGIGNHSHQSSIASDDGLDVRRVSFPCHIDSPIDVLNFL